MNWVKIFDSRETARSQVAIGRTRLVVVNGRKICLALVGDRLLAVQDRCSHNGESLSKGTINYLGEVICPWHGYRFNLKTGRESDERARDLETFPIREDGEGVFLGL